MVMQFSLHIKHLLGILMQVTDVDILSQYGDIMCNVTRCSLCPQALFLQAQSQIFLVTFNDPVKFLPLLYGI